MEVRDGVNKLRMMLLQSGGNTLDAYEVRLMLECESAELAAERATDEEIEAMGDAIAQMQTPGLSIDQRIDFDLEFHMRLCESSKNQMLVALAQVLRGLLRETIKATYLVDERELPRTIEHRRILEQVKCRDSKGAHAAMDIHMRSAAKGARA